MQFLCKKNPFYAFFLWEKHKLPQFTPAKNALTLPLRQQRTSNPYQQCRLWRRSDTSRRIAACGFFVCGRSRPQGALHLKCCMNLQERMMTLRGLFIVVSLRPSGARCSPFRKKHMCSPENRLTRHTLSPMATISRSGIQRQGRNPLAAVLVILLTRVLATFLLRRLSACT